MTTHQLKQHTIELLKKTAFRNKFAETTCESLGLSQELIQRAYQEVEGIVSSLFLSHTRTEVSAKFKSESPAGTLLPKFKNIDHAKFNQLIFGKTELSTKEWCYYENIDNWPKTWFRKTVDEEGGKRVRKAQLQIPLANLLPPGLYDEDQQFREDEEDSEGKLKEPKSRSAIELPPNLQKLAVVFESVLTNYVEEIAQNYVPSSIGKGLFPLVQTSLKKGNAEELLKQQHNRSLFLFKMRSKAVLRMWIYFGDDFDDSVLEKKNEEDGAQEESSKEETKTIPPWQQQELCRGHFDPGVCTILLTGSTPGLQLHRSFVGAKRKEEQEVEKAPGRDDDDDDNDTAAAQQKQKQEESTYAFATHDVFGQAKEEDWVDAGYQKQSILSSVIPGAAAEEENEEEEKEISNNNKSSTQQNYSPSNVVLMNGTMVSLLTGGVAQHVFHRVRADNWTSGNRVQIVFELRPDNAAKWYEFVPTEEEKKNLARY